MKDIITFDRKIGEKGDSLNITIPKALAEYLQLNKGDILKVGADEGKYGKFLSMWKEGQE